VQDHGECAAMNELFSHVAIFFFHKRQISKAQTLQDLILESLWTAAGMG
jgi:hypothetical protein